MHFFCIHLFAESSRRDMNYSALLGKRVGQAIDWVFQQKHFLDRDIKLPVYMRAGGRQGHAVDTLLIQ